MRQMDFSNVLLEGSIETRIKVTDNEVKITDCIGFEPVRGFLALRLHFFQDFSHHIEPGLVRVSAVGQMAVDETEGPFIEGKLDTQATFIANVACQPKCNHVLAPTMHIV